MRRGGANGQRTTKRAGSHKSRRRPLDPVFGVDSENRGLGGPFTDPGRALTESSVSRAPNLNLPARGHTPWLYKPDFRNQRRKWVLGAEREEFSTQYPLGPIGAEGEKKRPLRPRVSFRMVCAAMVVMGRGGASARKWNASMVPAARVPTGAAAFQIRPKYEETTPPPLQWSRPGSAELPRAVGHALSHSRAWPSPNLTMQRHVNAG